MNSYLAEFFNDIGPKPTCGSITDIGQCRGEDLSRLSRAGPHLRDRYCNVLPYSVSHCTIDIN
ncbi:hypothetical protein C7476_108175 [Phyllobacterium bourgognense]|uniref:Uncharacterized protein n=1 Tax=Phyllobacterium bourgognense TaxID=314236 RepID=A0A368YQ60_9HYPH|nr:hypothetical protein C7476_108175 [Phyllobacterium bourgognense]